LDRPVVPERPPRTVFSPVQALTSRPLGVGNVLPQAGSDSSASSSASSHFSTSGRKTRPLHLKAKRNSAAASLALPLLGADLRPRSRASGWRYASVRYKREIRLTTKRLVAAHPPARQRQANAKRAPPEFRNREQNTRPKPKGAFKRKGSASLPWY